MGPQEPKQPVTPAPEPVSAQPPQNNVSTPAPQTNAYGPSQPSSPSPKKKLSKGALWGIIGGAIGLVLLIVGVILAIVFLGGPSKDDYAKAYDKAQDLVSDYNKSDFISQFSDDLRDAKTDEDIDKVVDDLKSKYDKGNDELSKMKAMRDSEVKKAFEDYKKEYDEAFPYLKDMLKGYLVYSNVLKTCSSSAISTMSYSAKDKQAAIDAYDEKSKACVDFLNKYKDSNNKKLADFANEYLEYIGKFRTYAGDYAEASGKNDYNTLLDLDRPSSFDLPMSTDLIGDASDTDKYDFTDKFDDFVEILRDKK